MARRVKLAREEIERIRRLKTWLAMRGLSQRDLADALEIHPSMITRIFKGQRKPGERIRQLVELGVPPHLLPPPGTRGPGRPAKNRN
ncbi:helix-turn-helix domain protein [Desulfovibrio sp. X2]|uniref:helix-turn-helix domain-containing protein n=1 Tax=Desulfovibrio sp. X2 TaxID=941449 RepID=UPI0003589A54|nr:helix-turn-helix transcriptional regulator [Desulfovibrio sp. X2]EPR43675.1 helix-turn-helix domain protein [Desulfovibrio sp. X2]